MIFGNVNSKEDISLYPPALQKAIRYLKETDFAKMENGKYPIDDNMIVNIFEPRTAQRATKRPEVHRRDIDIHFMIRGCERDYYFMDMGDNVLDEDQFEALDVGFYKPNADALESYATLQAGSYACFFPEDVHLPSCSVDEDIDVRKVLIKLKVSAVR